MSESNKPVFKRVDHVALTVPDMEKAISFYTEVMGAELSYRMGPYDAAEIPAMEDGRDWSEAHVNVPGARLHIAMLKLADNLSMEMFEYEKPDGCKVVPANCDSGFSHICLEVDNAEETIAYMSSHGCTAMAGPILMEGGPGPDGKAWYVLDPFNNQLELVEYI